MNPKSESYTFSSKRSRIALLKLGVALLGVSLLLTGCDWQSSSCSIADVFYAFLGGAFPVSRPSPPPDVLPDAPNEQ